MERIFDLSGLLVLPFWLLMILLPTWRFTKSIMRSPLVILAPALLYTGLVLPRLADVFPAVISPSLHGIAALLGSPAGATIAWAHFLAFDLFVGRWAYLDSRERQINPMAMAPVLFFTLMLGPVGFFIYILVRLTSARPKDSGNIKVIDTSGATLPAASVIGSARSHARSFLKRAFATNRPLTLLGIVMACTLIATLIGMLVDPRVITGAPAWLKPAKFAISISIYSFTFVWLLDYVKGHERLVKWAANVTAFSLLVEMLIIVAQAARGTTSHFNVSTRFDMIMFSAMGVFIVAIWIMNLTVAILLLKQRLPDPVLAWSLRLGVIISLVGMSVGFLMTNPSNRPVTTVANGRTIVSAGAHSVGVADGGRGLPITGWSTEGGDLRVAHFVGIHALQVLPLVGWLVRRRRRHVQNGRRQVALIVTAGFGYLGLTLLLVWQALRGQSVIAPDSTTIVALIILGFVTFSAVFVTVSDAVLPWKCSNGGLVGS